MQKMSKNSIPEKTFNKSPAIMEGFDAMMRRSFKEEARRQLSVQPFTTPTRISKEYRNGYDEISWSVKK